jgi:5-methylcytosine-specific restriction endonuclease McrA
MTIQSPVLVLNASYEPVSVCAARRAITLLIKGAARLEECHDACIWKDMRLPSVIRLSRYRKIPQRRHDVTRRSILSRDQHTCQYCNTQLPTTRLTIDHVVPRSRGGRNTWENLVACCSACNRWKANRTPSEANMVLARPPRPSTLHTTRQMMRSIGAEDPKWRKYLYF